MHSSLLSSDSCDLEHFITSEWNRTIRVMLPEGDEGLPPLPRPFLAPCADEGFKTFFYWDSFYASIGLILQNRTDQVLDILENMRWLVENYGFIPNLYEGGQLYRSQPPHYALLVSLVCDLAPGSIDLKAHYEAMTKEYAFWHTYRSGAHGLNRYGHHATPVELASFGEMIRSRVPEYPLDPSQCSLSIAHYLAEAESGWDFTTRYSGSCMNYLPIDLNALLFGHEKACARIAGLLGDSDGAALWLKRADLRSAAINSLCWNESVGAFVDFDFVAQKPSQTLTAASFFPLWVGLATPEQAMSRNRILSALETKHGLLTMPERQGGLQWDAPNGWPPLQMVAMMGLLRYGFNEDAHRLAIKWSTMNERIFKETGKLWEKYNVLAGSLEVRDEYPMPSMMGWTAGAYLLSKRIISGEIHGFPHFTGCSPLLGILS